MIINKLMNKIFLSETEKTMLSRLGKSLYIKGMFKDIHLSDLNVAAKDLQNFGLINASWAYDSIFIDAEITDKSIIERTSFKARLKRVFSSFNLRIMFNVSASIMLIFKFFTNIHKKCEL